MCWTLDGLVVHEGAKSIESYHRGTISKEDMSQILSLDGETFQLSRNSDKPVLFSDVSELQRLLKRLDRKVKAARERHEWRSTMAILAP